MRSNIRSKIIGVFTNPYFHTATVKIRIRIGNKIDTYVDFNRTMPKHLYRVRYYA